MTEAADEYSRRHRSLAAPLALSCASLRSNRLNFVSVEAKTEHPESSTRTAKLSCNVVSCSLPFAPPAEGALQPQRVGTRVHASRAQSHVQRCTAQPEPCTQEFQGPRRAYGGLSDAGPFLCSSAIRYWLSSLPCRAASRHAHRRPRGAPILWLQSTMLQSPILAYFRLSACLAHRPHAGARLCTQPVCRHVCSSVQNVPEGCACDPHCGVMIPL